jgi:hypothetical protein
MYEPSTNTGRCPALSSATPWGYSSPASHIASQHLVGVAREKGAPHPLDQLYVLTRHRLG